LKLPKRYELIATLFSAATSNPVSNKSLVYVFCFALLGIFAGTIAVLLIPVNSLLPTMAVGMLFCIGGLMLTAVFVVWKEFN